MRPVLFEATKNEMGRHEQPVHHQSLCTMSSECAEEETERFSSIKQDMELLEEAMKRKDYKEGMACLLRINQSMETVFDQYAKNHDMHQPTMIVNMDHCLTIRNTLLYNVLWVIGPFIYPTQADVDWDTFTSVLPVSKEVLRDGYDALRHVMDDETIRKIVTISLKAGTIDDFEIAGIVYSTSYFLHFLLKQEETKGPFLPLVDAFYSHMRDYSFVLLVTSVLSLQRSVRFLMVCHPQDTRKRCFSQPLTESLHGSHHPARRRRSWCHRHATFLRRRRRHYRTISPSSSSRQSPRLLEESQHVQPDSTPPFTIPTSEHKWPLSSATRSAIPSFSPRVST